MRPHNDTIYGKEKLSRDEKQREFARRRSALQKHAGAFAVITQVGVHDFSAKETVSASMLVRVRVGLGLDGTMPGAYYFSLAATIVDEKGHEISNGAFDTFTHVFLTQGVVIDVGSFTTHSNPQPGKYTLRVEVTVDSPDHSGSVKLTEGQYPYTVL